VVPSSVAEQPNVNDVTNTANPARAVRDEFVLRATPSRLTNLINEVPELLLDMVIGSLHIQGPA